MTLWLLVLIHYATSGNVDSITQLGPFRSQPACEAAFDEVSVRLKRLTHLCVADREENDNEYP